MSGELDVPANQVAEQEVEIEANGNVLFGTFCSPASAGPLPIVLMVHGSGPLDRNENMPGQKLNIFNAIAHHLAKNGIASLRYDKRGCGKSTGNHKTAGHFDHVCDASACIEYLEQHDFCLNDQIYVLGHSEGSIIAPQLSLKHLSVAGILLISPFVQGIEPILRQQAKHIKEEINELAGFRGICFRILVKLGGDVVLNQDRTIEKVKASTTPTIRYKFRKIEAKWLKELMQLEPSRIFRQVTCPMLVIGGQKDVQCNPDDVDRIAELAQGEVERHIVQDLTHILRFDSGKPSIFRYKKLLKKPVERCVLELISNWLKRRLNYVAAS